MSFHPLDAKEYLTAFFRIPIESDEVTWPAVLLYLWQDFPIEPFQFDNLVCQFDDLPKQLGMFEVCQPDMQVLSKQNETRDLLWGFMVREPLTEFQVKQFKKVLASELKTMKRHLGEGGGYCGAVGRNPYAAFCQLVRAEEGAIYVDDFVFEDGPAGCGANNNGIGPSRMRRLVSK